MKNKKHKLKIKNIKFLIFGLCFWFLVFGFLSSNAFAQDDFVGPIRPLVVCGFGTADPCTICDIWALANRVIDFILYTLATPILIIVLIAGGFIYLTSGGDTKKTETAKGLLTSAIFGIIIAFAAWLIVDTILKTLVNDKFTIAWQEIEECPKPLEPESVDLEAAKKRLQEFYNKNPQGTFSDAEARSILRGLGIPVNKDNCSSPSETDCTSLDGIPQSTLSKLTEFKTSCVGENCEFIITGGTEAGHETHRVNQPIIDMAPLVYGTDKKLKNPTAQDYKTLRDLMIKTAGAINGKTFCETPSNQISAECAGADHIHVEFPR